MKPMHPLYKLRILVPPNSQQVTFTMRSTSNTRLVPLGLIFFLVLFDGSLAQQLSCKPKPSPRLRGRSDCQFHKITAREPNRQLVSEAGFSEFWDAGDKDELECAGVEVVRHTINPKGLLLPYYPNTPELVYVVRGQGIQGTVLPGCEETFQTSFTVEGGAERFTDKHQKVYRYKEGDVLALPAGAVHWTYNDGDKPTVVVALRDTSNVANQLDRNFKKFFLAGNPQSQMQQGEPLPDQPRSQPGPQDGRSLNQDGTPDNQDRRGPYMTNQVSQYGNPTSQDHHPACQDRLNPASRDHNPACQDRQNPANQVSQDGRSPNQDGTPDSQGHRDPYLANQLPGWKPGQPGSQPSPQPGQPKWVTCRPSKVYEDPCAICRQIQGGNDESCGNCNKVHTQQEVECFNKLAGFDDEILHEIFDIEYDIVRQLKRLFDDRGLIVLAENFHVLVPEEQEQFSPNVDNDIEQTICSTLLSANIGKPAFVDVYNPRGGRISSLNSHKLPVLESFQLSAEKGLLYKNAVLAPHYSLNAHSIIYITSGSSRLQIVGNDGTRVFDDVVKEGQLIVVPQDFAVIKKAGEEGCEWVAFKTNDNAITTQLAGRFSYIRSLPEEVLVNSYNISRQEAKSLKYNRKEGVVLSPHSASPIKKAKNVVLNALFG
ncbi:11S globulin subunit beta-like [Bidens hawaiensis]|uniref:11S globulin subunit beta-like n=1 Tax=Bidens hawaiensis TaxID=980011 RepID=UPI00404AA0D4